MLLFDLADVLFDLFYQTHEIYFYHRIIQKLISGRCYLAPMRMSFVFKKPQVNIDLPPTLPLVLVFALALVLVFFDLNLGLCPWSVDLSVLVLGLLASRS
jgi:hypothetical protein